MNKRKIIFGIITVIWMTIIFIFSSRNGAESTVDSYDVGLIIGRMVVPAFETMTEDEQLEFAAKVDHPVRKTAHAAEYALLGFLIVGTYYDSNKKRKKGLVVPWLIGTAYAATDEIHQLFVPGRSGLFKDVLLDSSGVLVGVMLSLIIIFKIFKKQREQGV